MVLSKSRPDRPLCKRFTNSLFAAAVTLLLKHMAFNHVLFDRPFDHMGSKFACKHLALLFIQDSIDLFKKLRFGVDERFGRAQHDIAEGLFIKRVAFERR